MTYFSDSIEQVAVMLRPVVVACTVRADSLRLLLLRFILLRLRVDLDSWLKSCKANCAGLQVGRVREIRYRRANERTDLESRLLGNEIPRAFGELVRSSRSDFPAVPALLTCRTVVERDEDIANANLADLSGHLDLATATFDQDHVAIVDVELASVLRRDLDESFWRSVV